MKKFFMSASALALLLGTMATIQAAGPCCGCCEPCCPPKASKPKVFLEIKFKPITLEVTEDTWGCEEVVKYVKCVEKVPVWTEKKTCVTTYQRVAREIEKEVVSCHLVPECVCDPCTGCSKICYKPHTCVQKVKCCVWDCVPTQQVVTEKVCSYECREKTIKQVCKVPVIIEETRPVPVTLVTFEAYKGKLPAEKPCPKPAPAPCSCGK